MRSLDTQILLYGLNADCDEHEACAAVLANLAAAPADWLVADQVLLELYRLLRNPAVLPKPLSAPAARAAIAYFDACGCHRVGHTHDLWPHIVDALGTKAFPAKRTFDLQLAHCLLSNGVTTFYTRNTKDFASFGFASLRDPLKA